MTANVEILKRIAAARTEIVSLTREVQKLAEMDFDESIEDAEAIALRIEAQSTRWAGWAQVDFESGFLKLAHAVTAGRNGGRSI